jgi:hypothetical protein
MDGQTAEEDFSSLSTIDKLQHKVNKRDKIH